MSVTHTYKDVLFFSFQHNKPLYSFEDNADYVYDVMWSPVHPAMFAAVDGMGRLDLWNLNNDTEVCEYVNIGHCGRIVCVMSLCVCVCVCVFGVLRACCWASARTAQPNTQAFSLSSLPTATTTNSSESLPTHTIQDSRVGVSPQPLL